MIGLDRRSERSDHWLSIRLTTTYRKRGGPLWAQIRPIVAGRNAEKTPRIRCAVISLRSERNMCRRGILVAIAPRRVITSSM